MAWKVASASCISSEGVARSLSLLPTAPRKSPITAMSGLKTLEDAGAAPAGGADGGGASGSVEGGGDGSGDGSGEGDGAGGGSGDGDGSGVTCAQASPLDNSNTTNGMRRRQRRDIRMSPLP